MCHLSDTDKLTVVRHHAGVSDGDSFTLVINTIGTWRVAKGAEIISGYFRLSRQLHELCTTRLLGVGMTSLGFPGLSSLFRVFVGPFRPENPEEDWDYNPGLPGLVIPVRFRLFSPPFGQATPKQTGMTSLGFPGLSSQSVWVCVALCGQKTAKRTGMTTLGLPGLSSQCVSRYFGHFRPENPQTDWDGFPGLSSQSV